MLLGFAEDYKMVLINAKHELNLTRARSDSNAIISATDDCVFHINKLLWRILHVTASDEGKLKMLKVVSGGKPITMCFRSRDLYEYPLLAKTNNHSWTVKTSNQLEKPRFAILALQTDRKNNREKDYNKFDHCNITDVKLYLNSEVFPYDNLNLGFSISRFVLLYNMYASFQQSYYNRTPAPLLKPAAFGSSAPIIVIDCSHQSETIKSGPVDVRLEFKTTVQVSDLTSAYCFLIHDRIVDYHPLTNEVRKR